ncbi:TerB family tellurite resistance protein [Craterilacuibacter sp. RT1T]|nr:TerB family tellurite resistance protein [Craterilacuibacter sp. RT1T]MCL6263131.1 TerB family tellurite resistance protein [Craterilacuibacter sp. RT1T]
MNRYAPNSPESMARLLAMFMITDGNMDERELDALENLHVYSLLGLSRKRFVATLTQLCDEISDEAQDDGLISMFDKDRIDGYLDAITDRQKRLLTAALAIDVCKSDGVISDAEMALLRYMLGAWRITLDDVEAELIRR